MSIDVTPLARSSIFASLVLATLATRPVLAQHTTTTRGTRASMDLRLDLEPDAGPPTDSRVFQRQQDLEPRAGTDPTESTLFRSGRGESRLDLGAIEEQPVLLGALQDEPAPESPAQSDPMASASEQGDGWAFTVDTFIWLLNIDGTIKVKGQEVDVSVDIFDIADEADALFGLPLRLSARHGPWGLFVEPQYSYAKFEDDLADLTLQMLFLEFGGSYRLLEEPLPKANRDWWLEGLVGCRYTYVDIEVDPQGLSAVGVTEDWLDPFIGLRTSVPLDDRWTFGARVDVGGFDVGSDFTWQALGFFSCRIGSRSLLHFGYRALDQRYVPKRGALWDVTLHGPALGLSFEF